MGALTSRQPRTRTVVPVREERIPAQRGQRAPGQVRPRQAANRDSRRSVTRQADRRAARKRMRRRQRRSLLLLLLLTGGTLLGLDVARGQPRERPDLPVSATLANRPAPDLLPYLPIPEPSAAGSAATYPASGPGTFTYALDSGPVFGTTGILRRFRIAVENGMGQDVVVFASAVDAILVDPRGWTASGQVRLQRVPREAPAEFTIVLGTPGTSERMCAAGGLYTQRFTSCRLPGQVIVNVARWLEAVPDYGASLDVYRAYALNHEVGHELGYGHQACPAPGRPAPVMQQQTYGLRGCVANGWPYIDGRRYGGPLVA
jgi:hypothetical protein